MDSVKETAALHEVLQLLTSNYEPANQHNFDTTHTTAELKAAAEEHTGLPVELSAIVGWLKENGYVSSNIGQLSLVWLFRKKI